MRAPTTCGMATSRSAVINGRPSDTRERLEFEFGFELEFRLRRADHRRAHCSRPHCCCCRRRPSAKLLITINGRRSRLLVFGLVCNGSTRPRLVPVQFLKNSQPPAFCCPNNARQAPRGRALDKHRQGPLSVQFINFASRPRPTSDKIPNGAAGRGPRLLLIGDTCWLSPISGEPSNYSACRRPAARSSRRQQQVAPKRLDPYPRPRINWRDEWDAGRLKQVAARDGAG